LIFYWSNSTINGYSKPYKEFDVMKFNLKTIVSNLQRHLATFVSALLIAAVIWQSAINLAVASPLLATSANSISKQVTGKAEEIKGNAKQSIGKAQSAMEDKNRDMKMKVKDDLNEAKIAVEGGAARVKNSADKATTTVKDFFGK
jgi:ABC-type multidrug transport system fused ATPase/permease subunit